MQERDINYCCKTNEISINGNNIHVKDTIDYGTFVLQLFKRWCY